MKGCTRLALALCAALLSAGTARATTIAWAPEAALRAALPPTAHTRAAALAAGSRIEPVAVSFTPLTLAEEKSEPPLDGATDALFGRMLASDFTSSALATDDLLGSLWIGPGPDERPRPRTSSPTLVESALRSPRGAVSRPSVRYRGEVGTLLPFGMGLLGIGFAGRRRRDAGSATFADSVLAGLRAMSRSRAPQHR